jgi:ribosomal protein L23
MKKLETSDVLLYPLATEKAIRAMESDNMITFIVHKKSNKQQIKKAFEEMFKVRVTSIRTQVSLGKKKAYIRVSRETSAIDIATKLGLM